MENNMKPQKDGWSLKTLEEELEFYNGKVAKFQSSGNFPVYGSNGIIGYTDSFLYVDSIILGRVGAYCGAVFYEKKKFWPSDNTIVVTSKKPGNNMFFYYVLKNYPIRSFAGGAAQPLITHSLLKKFQMRLPNEDIERKKIGALLSNYDYLIDNNSRRIQLLESIAKLIYDEWFVKFKFPGHEKIQMTDSGTEFGEIPDGWIVINLQNCVEKINIKYKENEHNQLSLLDLSRIPRKSLMITEYGPNNFLQTSRCIFNEYDILFGSIRPYFHKVVFAHTKGITNSSVFVLRPKEGYFEYILMNLFDDKTINWATTNSQGTKMPVIAWDVLKKKNILHPTKNILDEYKELVKPLFLLIKELSMECINLSTTRDLLLPKLMSGELDVSELDIKIAEAII